MPDNNSSYVIQVNSLVYVLKKTCTRIIVAIFVVERKKLKTMLRVNCINKLQYIHTKDFIQLSRQIIKGEFINTDKSQKH